MKLRVATIIAASISLLALDAYAADAARSIGPITEAVNQSDYALVLHVANSGSDTADGSAATPLASIGAALAKGAQAGGRCAILVAAGTYAGTTVEMQPRIDLFGGFAASDWHRDILANKTVIDGEKLRRPVLGADDARIDGFVIRNGRADGPGGGILCHRCAPTITNNFIIDNLAVEPSDYVYGLFHQVGNEGGGIACIDSAHPSIRNNVIVSNQTNIGGGGAITARNFSMPSIESNVILNNRTGLKDNDPDKKKRARSSNGGAISASHASRPERRMRIVNNVIAGNRVGGNSDAGGIYCEYDSSPLISGNYILNNTAEDDGGGIYVMKSSEPLIIDNTFMGNKGGAIRFSKEGRGRVHNNIFYANPGAIICVDSWIVCSNNTMVDSGGTNYINRLLSMKPAVFMNNLLWDRGTASGISVDALEPPVLSHNNMATSPSGEGNFQADPGFANDGLSVELASARYDPTCMQTTLALSKPVTEPQRLAGRPIRIGEAWSVVAASAADQLRVWGDLQVQAAEAALIPPTFRFSRASPCLAKGVPIPKTLWGVETEVPPQAQVIDVGATPVVIGSAQASGDR